MGAKTERRHAQGDESRERILDATIEIAALRGYHGTSIAAVSKHSGLPASSIYWHFASKDDLFAAVIQRSFDQWLATATRVPIAEPGVSVGAHMVAKMQIQAEALLKSPEFLRLGLLLALEQHPDEPSARGMFLRVRKQSLDALVESFGELIAAVRGVSDPRLARRFATITMAAADGLFIAHQIDPSAVDLRAEFDLLARVFFAHIQSAGN